jgi:hypothetical protein
MIFTSHRKPNCMSWTISNSYANKPKVRKKLPSEKFVLKYPFGQPY